jgi:hypothetical protein
MKSFHKLIKQVFYFIPEFRLLWEHKESNKDFAVCFYNITENKYLILTFFVVKLLRD